MSKTAAVSECPVGADCGTGLTRSIDWKQGIIIAMGVPILILPSLYDLNETLWAMSIVIWVVSVLQGFLQNLAIGEMAATFGCAGIGACAQKVFTNDERYRGRRVNWGRFIGAFTAWSYWFTWTPVIPIFTIMTGAYLQAQFDLLADLDATSLDLVLGLVIFGAIIFIGSRGLNGGATAQLVLALITIIPLVIVVSITFFNGGFEMGRVTDDFIPAGWNWDGDDICMMLGCLAVAQWSACAWESAATYGAEYKKPGKDLPKALIGCGLICLFMYFLVSFAVYGNLGYAGVDEAGYATLVPICVTSFGDVGSYIAIILLVAGMIMLIQTAFLGSSRTLFVMSQNRNMPSLLSKTNSKGAPIYAMSFQFVVGMCIIPLGTPGMILAASSFGFCFALGMAMMAFIKARRDPRFKDVPRAWKAPRGWFGVAAGLMCFQFLVLIPCLGWESYNVFGPSSVVMGALILTLYIPVWFALQYFNGKKDLEDAEEESDSSASSSSARSLNPAGNLPPGNTFDDAISSYMAVVRGVSGRSSLPDGA